MEAKDLMIGDWLLDGHVYAQVTSITCDGNIETTHNEHSNIELIEPIPLTSKVLEKNGFTKSTPPLGIHARCYHTSEGLWQYKATKELLDQIKQL